MAIMMKKLIFVLWLVLGISPAFAQGNKVVQTGAKLATSGDIALRVARQVEKQAALHAVSAVSGMQLAQIANLPGCPTVSVRRANPAPGGVTGVLPARILNYKELHSFLHHERQIYVPLSFAKSKTGLYRGMQLENLDDVKNLLINGMEVSKTAKNAIFADSRLPVNMSYALPDPYEESSFPVLVRIKLTKPFLKRNPPAHLNTQWIFPDDIPAAMLPDVMVFLEIGGEPGWYKVTLENGELVFTPAPSRVFNLSELADHKINIPERNRDPLCHP